jgi:hypothetical protein
MKKANLSEIGFAVVANPLKPHGQEKNFIFPFQRRHCRENIRLTNKASIGRKAALGLRQIAALMAPSASSLRSQPSCRQCGNFLRLSNVAAKFATPD